MERKEKYMEGMKRPHVIIDVQKHIKTFINPYDGQEYTEEQFRELSRQRAFNSPTNKSDAEIQEPNKDAQENGGDGIEKKIE